MRLYQTKVTVISASKKYQPGETLPADFPSADLEMLKRRGFVKGIESNDSIASSEEEEETGIPFNDEEGFGYQEGNEEGLSFLSEDELNLMKKSEISAYATSIGLTITGSTKEAMINEVLNYIEEQQEA